MQLDVPTRWDGSCYGPTSRPTTMTCGAGTDLSCTGGASACNVSATVAEPTVTGGNCQPQDIDVFVPELRWKRLGWACGGGALGGGCGDGRVCAPRPQRGFRPGQCISRPGDNECPAGSYSEKHVYYERATDDRGCEACSCSAPKGGTCSATVELYSDLPATICNNKVASIPAGRCVDLKSNPTLAGRRAIIGATTNGTCQPQGGAPRGSATEVAPMTFCCVPPPQLPGDAGLP